jgi:hypothetical protein
MENGAQAQVRVRAVFPHCLLFFDLPADMRKADLATLVESFGKSRGAPLSVKVILPQRRAPSRLARPGSRLAPFGPSS